MPGIEPGPPAPDAGTLTTGLSELVNIKITNVLLVYMVWDIVILRWANPLLEPFEGVGPESLHFLRAQKNRDFQGPPLQMALEMDLAASKSLYPAPFKQQVH